MHSAIIQFRKVCVPSTNLTYIIGMRSALGCVSSSFIPVINRVFCYWCVSLMNWYDLYLYSIICFIDFQMFYSGLWISIWDFITSIKDLFHSSLQICTCCIHKEVKCHLYFNSLADSVAFFVSIVIAVNGYKNIFVFFWLHFAFLILFMCSINN